MTIPSHQRPGARLLVPKGPPAGSATRPRGSVPWPEALAAVPSEDGGFCDCKESPKVWRVLEVWSTVRGAGKKERFLVDMKYYRMMSRFSDWFMKGWNMDDAVETSKTKRWSESGHLRLSFW